MSTTSEWLTLDSGEEIVWTGKPRIRRIVSNVASSVFWSLVAVVVAVALTSVLNLQLPVSDPLVWGIAGLWIAIQAIAPITAYLRTTNIDYVLTNKNIYKKTGVLSENVTRVGVDKVQNTQLQKDFFGNIFDYGTILLSTAGGEGVEMTIEDLNDPDTLRDELRSRMAAASDWTQGERESHGISPETVQTLVAEARKMHETAENIERHFQ